MHFTALASLCGLALAQYVSGSPLVERANNPNQDRAHTAIKSMQRPQYFKTPSPAAWTIGWWNNAQCVTLLADLRATDNSPFLRQLTDGEQGIFNVTWRDQARDSNGALTYTRWFDDRLWWAVAQIKVYDVTKNPQYLVTARKTFALVDKDDVKAPCGLYNNAYPDVPHGSSTITQALYIEVAALLAARSPNQKAEYLKKANKAWAELKKLTYIDGLIQGDGIQGDGNTCSNNHAFLTYQEGVAMAAMVAMKQATGNDKWLDIGQSIAEKTISGKYGMLVDGIAKEFCDDDYSCNGDTAQFKGIMMRGFLAMHKARPSTANGAIPAMLKKNAASIWKNNRDKKNQILGLKWAGPYKRYDQVDYRLAAHVSATMALVYASQV